PADPALPDFPITVKPLALARLFSAGEDFSDAFLRFLHPAPATTGQAMLLDLSEGRFLYHDPTKAVTLTPVRFVLHMRPGSGDPSGLKATLIDPGNGSHDADGPKGVAPDALLAGLPTLGFSLKAGATGPWSLQVAEGDIPAPIAASAGGHTRIDPSAIADVT